MFRAADSSKTASKMETKDGESGNHCGIVRQSGVAMSNSWGVAMQNSSGVAMKLHVSFADDPRRRLRRRQRRVCPCSGAVGRSCKRTCAAAMSCACAAMSCAAVAKSCAATKAAVIATTQTWRLSEVLPLGASAYVLQTTSSTARRYIGLSRTCTPREIECYR